MAWILDRKWRALEVGACVAALVVLSPLLAAIAVAIVAETGFPVLFRHVRVGQGGAAIHVLKFRSMRNGGGGVQVTASNDRRVTRVGRVLRRYKLDELPQLWNVVRGDMSLVGPRPEAPPFVNMNEPAWRSVLAVKPGITDVATLVFRDEERILAGAENPEEHYRMAVVPEKLSLNLRYISRRSPWRDAQLLALTLLYSFVPQTANPERVLRLLSDGGRVG
jgi:lipopolysaccharide/colanic/teichoic acid biosynthesis glycosyltransferase